MQLSEDFLHYLWIHKLLILNNLKTSQLQLLEIIQPGSHNLNAGPDFCNAQLIIDNQHWAGNVEIHVNASDWYLHKHETDSNYQNVILHVVWNYDIDIFDSNSQKIPTLEIKNYLNPLILTKYYNLFRRPKKWINCENEIQNIDSFLLENWKERLFFERLEQKTILIENLLQQSNNDWERVLFQLLAKNFGMKVNADAFFNLSNSINFNLIRKYRHNAILLESLFLGQGGFLENDSNDNYYNELKDNYNFLKKTYKLEPIFNGQFNFFRLRPNNFPTIRISQLANLYSNEEGLFSKIIEINMLKEFYNLFDTKASSYWETHFTFSTSSKKRSKKVTKSFIELLLINTIIPFKFLYLKKVGKFNFDVFIDFIKQIKSEKNSVINHFSEIKIQSESMLDSQALLQLKNNYCIKNNCLQCAIGNSIIKN